MKNGFRSFGKAILYALAYLLIQNLVGLVYTISVDFTYFLKHPDILHLGPSQIVSLIEYMHAGNSGLHIILPLFLSNLVAVLLIWIFFAVRKKKFSQEIGLHKIIGKNLAAAIVFGGTFSIVLTTAIALIPFPQDMVESLQANSAALPNENTLLNLITIVLVGPIAEEVFFRGLIYTRLKKGMNTVAAAILSSVLFGIGHGGFIWFFSAFVAGLAMVWIFETTGSLFAAIAVHMANNAIAQLTQNVTGIPFWSIGVCLAGLVLVIIYLIRNNRRKPVSAVFPAES